MTRGTADFVDPSFRFPPHCHILISTPGEILAWDLYGVKTLFSSSKGGIVAAVRLASSPDTLAVADRHVVVLHDTSRAQERSWGLSAHEDDTRQLRYESNARSLFISKMYCREEKTSI